MHSSILVEIALNSQFLMHTALKRIREWQAEMRKGRRKKSPKKPPNQRHNKYPESQLIIGMVLDIQESCG